MNKPITPESILPYKHDYKEGAWTEYSLAELGWFVHLLVQRSSHRANLEKRRKDLYDARNYLNMMDAQLDHLEDQLYEDMKRVEESNVSTTPEKPEVGNEEIPKEEWDKLHPDAPDLLPTSEEAQKVDPPEGIDPDKPDLPAPREDDDPEITNLHAPVEKKDES